MRLQSVIHDNTRPHPEEAKSLTAQIGPGPTRCEAELKNSRVELAHDARAGEAYDFARTA
jgi:hypothetical protein